MAIITKDRISSPLEAGLSLHDSTQLPAQLRSALDYLSCRLARKRLHLSLIVVPKDVQIPANSSPTFPPQSTSPPHSITTSPARSLFTSASSTISRSLTRHPSNSSISDSISSTSSLSCSRWPSSPLSPNDASVAPAPTSPSCSSPRISHCSTPDIPNPYGITLMHASTLTPKAEKIQRYYISKAEKKFSIGSGWLSPSNTITCPARDDLIRRSLAQKSILFTGEGLTLLALDHVYTFKCHLHTYSRTLSPSDLTTAVDELRRLVLAQHGRRITKGYLIRAYNWLSVSLAALEDVNEGYKVAYGGVKRVGGIEVQDEERRSPPPLKTNFRTSEIRAMKVNVGCCGQEKERIRVVDFAESAKSFDGGIEDKGPHMRGPMTPNGFEDITPITKGEWCFLMVGEGWNEARTVAVETC